METAFAELPLAIFTTLASIGAGSFIVLACVLWRKDLSSTQMKALDRAMIVPFMVAGAGFVASFLHLTAPLHAVYVFSGVGSSPLTNEICCGIVFMAAAFLYLVLAFIGKLGNARKPFALVVAVLATVFVIFVGLAYIVPTIVSWNTALVPAEMLGYALVGGTALMVCVAQYAGVLDEETRTVLKMPLVILVVCGLVLALAAPITHIAIINGLGNAVSQGSALVSEVLPYVLVGLVLIALSAVELLWGIAKGFTLARGLRSTLEALVGIFLLRLTFYALYLSIGVTLM